MEPTPIKPILSVVAMKSTISSPFFRRAWLLLFEIVPSPEIGAPISGEGTISNSRSHARLKKGDEMVDFMATTERIGFIGVGSMGHGIAGNLVEKGFPLTIMGHRNRAPVEDLVKRGAVEAKSPAEVAERSTIVFLCVTGSTEVEAIVRGPNGLKATLKPDSIVVDCSSSDPTSTTCLLYTS